MILGIGIVALVFFGISFIITHGNAAQLLSGYNTMSEQERESVDIVGYVNYFRKFYRMFSLTYFLLGVLIYYFVNVDAAGVYMVIAPLIAVLIQSVRSAKYNIQNNNKSAKVVGALLVGIIVLVIGLLWLGYKENELLIQKDALTISGMYGETIPFSAIDSIALVNELPEISMKSDGFALGNASKGHFKTKAGERIKLIVNKKQAPYLFVLTNEGKKIYYSSDSAQTRGRYLELASVLTTN